MKGYTNFMDGFLGPGAVATKPIGKTKYMDWKKVQQIVDEHPDSVIYAGLQEDWGYTSGLIFAKGEYYNGVCVYGSSSWATPIVDVDGEEIECWTYEETEEGHNMPTWWGNGAKLKSEFEYNDDDEEEKEDDLDDEEQEYCENDIRMTQDTYGKIKEDMDKMVKEMQKEMERKNTIEEIERKEEEIRELKDRIKHLEKYKKYEELADEVKAVHDAFLNVGFNEATTLELVKLMFQSAAIIAK